ncbi:MAG: glycosyltransferase family 39 protein [Candidatus Heimdallarchaeota archaeon]|nr:glycosyltransferase family 39 protein [Candidatus Heimdallarchaeota archaeon]
MKSRIKAFIIKNWIVILIWFLAFLVRILASIFSKGYIHPDEHYQSIEIAYYEIFGEGYIPWEFVEGVRSWVYPGIVLLIFKVMIWIGVTNIEILLIFVRLFSACCSMITVITVYFLGKDLFDEKVGLVATIFVSFWFDFVFWSARTMSDSIAANFTLLGIFIIVHFLTKQKELDNLNKQILKNKIKMGLIPGFLAGLMFGLSFIFKFPAIILALPFGLWLLVKKKWSAMSFFIIGIGVMVLLQGIIDVFTWGAFLQSPIKFFNYNIFTGQNEIHGTSPFFAYPFLIFDAYGDFFILFLLFFVFGLNKEKNSLWLLFAILFFLLVFSFIGHKEYRFLLPIMPISVIFAAKGFLEYPKKIKRYNIRKGIFVFFCDLYFRMFFSKFILFQNISTTQSILPVSCLGL